MTAIPVGAVCGLKVDTGVKGWGEEHVGSPSHGPHPTPLTTGGVGAQATVYRRLPHGQTELLQAYVDDNVSASPATWSQRQPPGYGRQCVWQRALRPTKSRQAHAKIVGVWVARCDGREAPNASSKRAPGRVKTFVGMGEVFRSRTGTGARSGFRRL